jgi:hypothetical protein
MTTKGKPASNDAHIPSGQNDSMEQIRELLFGEQQRSTEAQLLSTKERIDQLRQHTLDELAEAEARLNRRLEQLAANSTENHQDLQAQLREGLHSLQQQLERRIDDVETVLQSQQAELARQIGAEQDRLQNDKINRSQLARLLTQLAAQIESDD